MIIANLFISVLMMPTSIVAKIRTGGMFASPFVLCVNMVSSRYGERIKGSGDS